MIFFLLKMLLFEYFLLYLDQTLPPKKTKFAKSASINDLISQFVVTVIHHVFDYDSEEVMPAKFYSLGLFPLPKDCVRIDGLSAHLQKMSLL